MNDRTLTVEVKVCPKDHGGQGNTASFYGHYGSSGVCIRIGTSNTWVYDPTIREGVKQ